MERFTVGDWTVEPDLDRISSVSGQVSLQPQVMELLVYLAERKGEVVSIDEMIEEVWNGRLMSSGSVYNRLNALRQALDDDVHQPRYIETIPKRGYRLIADVAREAPAQFDFTELKKSKRKTNLRWGLALAAVAVAFLLWQLSGKRQSPEPELPPRSIAVLPFVDLSPDGDQEYFAHGVSEEILNVIAGFPGLKVAGRTSSFQFKGREVDLREVGRQLGVSYILEGSVRRANDQLRITAQLIKASDGFHVWSRDFDAAIGKVFEIQDQIAASIARELELSVMGESGPGQGGGSTRLFPDFGTYDLLMLARARVNGGSLQELEEAVELLEQALDQDPEYANIHAELAYAFLTMMNLHSTNFPERDWDSEQERMKYHADMALELNPMLADAHFVKASTMYGSKEGVNSADQLATVLALYNRAIELNPNHARAHLWLSGSMRDSHDSWVKRLQPARKAIDLDPLWPFAKQFYLSLTEQMPDMRRERWEIFRELKSSQAGTDRFASTLSLEIRSLMNEGRLAEAINLGESVFEDMVEGGDIQRSFISALYLLGAPEKIPPEVEVRPIALAHLFPARNRNDAAAFDEACFDPELDLPSIRYVMCAYEEMLRGNLAGSREILESNLEVDPEDFSQYREWHWALNARRSPVIALAFIHKLGGNDVLARAYIEIEEGILSSESENGTIDSPEFSRTRARIHALRGENELAIAELGKMIDWGEINFRNFMEPVFNDLRGHPGYEALKIRWIGIINAEREKLGWEPLTLNPEAGPGNLPFLLGPEGAAN